MDSQPGGGKQGETLERPPLPPVSLEREPSLGEHFERSFGRMTELSESAVRHAGEMDTRARGYELGSLLSGRLDSSIGSYLSGIEASRARIGGSFDAIRPLTIRTETPGRYELPPLAPLPRYEAPSASELAKELAELKTQEADLAERLAAKQAYDTAVDEHGRDAVPFDVEARYLGKETAMDFEQQRAGIEDKERDFDDQRIVQQGARESADAQRAKQQSEATQRGDTLAERSQAERNYNEAVQKFGITNVPFEIRAQYFGKDKSVEQDYREAQMEDTLVEMRKFAGTGSDSAKRAEAYADEREKAWQELPEEKKQQLTDLFGVKNPGDNGQI